MTPVSTVSSGTTGTYESYDFATRSYDTDSPNIEETDGSRVKSSKSYEGTGACEKRCPRTAPECVGANLGRRARCRALCGRVAVLAGEGVER